MKKIFSLISIVALLPAIMFAQSVGIGTATPNASAQLDVSSTSKGLLAPRMTQAQRNAILSPAPGLLVYQTDLVAGYYYYKDQFGGWQQITTGTIPNSLWNTLGITNNIYNAGLGNVGIGMLPPSNYRLSVAGDLSVTGNPPTLHLGGATGATSARIILAVPNAPEYKITNALDKLFISRSTGPAGYVNDFVINDVGNIGISNSYPDTKLHITDGTDVGNASGGYLQLGPTNGRNIGFDDNEIQARLNGVVSRLVLQNGGGALQIGSAGTPAGYAVSINGKVICEELKIQGSSSWPDYVFADNYILKPLPELKDFIRQNRHLPDIPPASEIEKNGIEVGDMQKRLMKKIEELTLYILTQEEKIKNIQAEMETIKRKVK